MSFVPLVPIGDPLSRCVDERTAHDHREALAALEERLRSRREEVHAGWGPGYVERVHKKGKLTARERLARLIDPGTRAYEVGTFVNYGEVFPGNQRSPGAGVVTAFACVEGRWCMVIANDNTVASGAWWPRTPEKIQRAQMMALRLRLPTIYLVDVLGGLRMEGDVGGACLGEVGNDAVHRLHHQVHVDGRRDAVLAQGLANERADGQVRHVMVVHHVEVHDVGAGLEDVVHLLAQPGEVGGEDARCDAVGHGVLPMMGLILNAIGTVAG